MKVRWARSATRHRVSRARSRYVIEHCGLILIIALPAEDQDDRLLYLGDDESGTPLEVMAIEVENGDLYVIHAMPLRDRYRTEYEEAMKWRV